MKLLFKYGYAILVCFAGSCAIASTSFADQPTPDISIWKTIELGAGPQNAGEFYKALTDAGFIADKPEDGRIFSDALQVTQTPLPVDLVRVSSKDLGFPQGAGYKEIYAAAKKLGLSLCRPEIGPQLRLSYTNQPAGETLIIAMEPTLLQRANYNEGVFMPRVFIVANTGKSPSLEEAYLSQNHGDDQWIFVK